MSKISINKPDGKGNDSFILNCSCTFEPKNPHLYEHAPKCKHNDGRWVIVDDAKKIHFFDPATQLQKDFWLDDCRENYNFDGAEYLKWLCFPCVTIQEP